MRVQIRAAPITYVVETCFLLVISPTTRPVPVIASVSPRSWAIAALLKPMKRVDAAIVPSIMYNTKKSIKYRRLAIEVRATVEHSRARAKVAKIMRRENKLY